MYTYKKDKAKAVLLYICGGLALGSCAALIIFFIFTLRLRTEYREVCLEINDAILASRIEDDRIVRGDESAPLTQKAADYYDMFLLDPDTTVFNRKVRDVTDKSVQLQLSGATLSFTGRGDGSEIHIRWESPAGVKCYTVRNTSMTFLQLNAYADNIFRHMNDA